MQWTELGEREGKQRNLEKREVFLYYREFWYSEFANPFASMMSFILLLAVMMTALSPVHLRSTGAPAEACSNLTPQHALLSSQTTPSPFNLSVDVFEDLADPDLALTHSYEPGSTYNLVLQVNDPVSNRRFRGFFIQARSVADGSDIGGFTAPLGSGGEYRLSSCSPPSLGATHVNPSDKTSVTIPWTAPPIHTGPIVFRYSFVQSFTTFWANLRSINIIERQLDVVIGFDPAEYMIREDGGEVAFMVRLINGTLDRPLVVEFFTTDGTAGEPSDYNSTMMLLTFDPSTSLVPASVPIVDDSAVEIDETFFGNLRLPQGSTANVMFRPQQALATITDDDPAVIGFPRTYLVREGVDASVTVDIQVRMGELGRPVVVRVFTAPDTAMAGSDYTPTTQMVTFSPSVTSSSITVAIQDDNIAEDREQFFARAELVSLDADSVVIDPATTTVTIDDNDNITIGFDQSTYDVVENVTFANVTVVLTGRTDRDIIFTLRTRDRTAVSIGSEADFGSVSRDYTFRPSPNIRQTIVVPIRIINDVFVEHRETLDSIISLSVADSRIRLDPAEASINIIDDDSVVIGFDSTTYMVDKNVPSGNVAVRVRIISDVLRRPVVVNFQTEDGSASAGADYTAVGPMPLTFNGNDTQFDILIPITNDNVNEPDETFRGILSTSESSGVVQLNPLSATITIQEDNEVFFTFREPVYVFMEGIGRAVVFVDKANTTEQTFQLMVSGPFQQETGSNVDRVLTFLPGETEKEISFMVVDDRIALEPIETLMWNLTMISPVEQGGVIAPYGDALIQITDDDDLMLRLSKNELVSEAIGDAEACITFSAPFATSFIINTSPSMRPNVSVEGGATLGEDFSAPPSSLSADPSIHGPSNDLCFSVPITNDTAVEVQECFGITIFLPSDLGNLMLMRIDPNNQSALYCIEDDDMVIIGFDPPSYSIDEPTGEVTLMVSLISGTLQRPVEVIFFTSDGTATSVGEIDFDALSNVALRFDGTTSSRSVQVTIRDDSILENSEHFYGNLSTTDRAVQLQPASVQVDILEVNDEVTIGFDPEDYAVRETEGQAVLMVRLISGTLERDVTILFETSPGSATEAAPSDYEGTSRLLTFSPSINMVPVEVNIINDDIVEGNETFFGILENQGQPVMTRPDRATVTIIEDANDRVRIGFEQELYVDEEGNTIEVCARIFNGDLERNLVVSISSMDMTARAGEDYTSINMDFTFGPSTSRLCVNVSLTDDDLLEMKENFTLDLTSDDPSVMLQPDRAVVEINDNDPITVGLEQTMFTSEEGTLVEVCTIVLAGMLQRNAIVTLRTIEDTATSSPPADFIPLTTQLTFTSDINRICHNISVLDDVLYEDPESFNVTLITSDSSVMIDPDRTTGRIVVNDNDAITIGFVREMDSVREDNGFIDICIEVKNNGMLEREVSVAFSTAMATGSNAATSDVDFVATAQDRTFTTLNQDQPSCVRVTINDDILFEGSEIFLGTLSTDAERVMLVPVQTTITITDDDGALNIGFINPPYSNREDAGFATVMVGVVSAILSTDLVVRLTTEDLQNIPNPATAGVDYTPLDILLTFSSTSTRMSINVSLTPDQFVEGNEVFQGRLELNTTGSGAVIVPDTAMITIIDDDRVVIGFEPFPADIPENIDGGMVELCARVMRGQLMHQVVIMVIYQDNSARDPEDYVGMPIPLTFSPGMERQCFNVTITDDNRYEFREQFQVNITTTDPQIDLMPNSVTVMIIDDDEINIGWEMTAYTTPESAGQVELCAALTGATLTTDLSPVNIRTVDGTAEAEDDYGSQSNPRRFEFSATSPRRMCTTITIQNDGILEDTESFFADLSMIPTMHVTIAPNRTQVFIADTDGPTTVPPTTAPTMTPSPTTPPPPPPVTIGFLEDSYIVDEDDGMVSVRVGVRSGSIRDEILVGFFLFDESANSMDDYSSESNQSVLIFNSNDTEYTVQVAIMNDTIQEPMEIFAAQLAVMNQPSQTVTLSPDRVLIIIEDDDILIIGFINPPYSNREDAGFATVMVGVVSAILSTDLVVRLTTEDLQNIPNPATAGVDYTPLDMLLTFSSTSTRMSINVSLTPDQFVEGNEVFQGRLELNTTGSGAMIVPDTAMITIIDDDHLIIGFEPFPGDVPENVDGGMVELCAGVMSGQLIRQAVIMVIYQDNSARAPEDYVKTPTSLIFSPGMERQCFNVTITDDNGYEFREQFQVNITTTDPQIDLMPNSVTVMIIDDDEITIGWEMTAYTTPESAGQVELCAALTGATLTTDLSPVNIRTVDGTAEAEDDYSSQSNPRRFEFSATSPRRMCTTITIQNDGILEDTESFFADLSMIPTMRVTIAPNRTQVFIADTDSAVIGFRPVSYTVNENGGVVTLTVEVLDGTLATDIVVLLRTTDGSAVSVGGSPDYQSVPTMLTFSPSQPQINVSVPIINDGMNEPDETFSANLTRLTDNFRVAIRPDTADVVIIDDDAVRIRFEEPTYTFREEDRVAVVCLIKDPMTRMPIIINNIATVQGTATEGVDYLGGPYSVNFTTAANDRQCINIPLVEDNESESPETFVVRLNLPVPGNDDVIAGSPDMTTVTILASGAVIGFRPVSYTVNENDGAVTLTAEVLDGTLATDIVVLLRTTDGSAVSVGGSPDYQSVPAMLTFSSSQPQINVSVPIIDDGMNEPDEMFSVNLTRLTDNSRVAIRPDTADVVIIDDDVSDMVVKFSSSSYTVSEDSGAVNLKIQRSGSLQRELRISLTFSDITARGGEDYGPFPTSELELSSIIPANVSETEFGMNIREDNIVEIPETFSVSLRLSEGMEPASIAEVVIEDNDFVMIRIEPQNFTVLESDKRTLTFFVQKTGMAVRDVSVILTAVSNTSRSGEDFMALRREIVFASDVEVLSVNLTILDDDIVEDTEEMTLVLTPGEGERAVQFPDGGVVRGTILDDDRDSVTICFSQDAYMMPEDSGIAVLQLLKKGMNERDVTVFVMVNDTGGTATEGVDFSLTMNAMEITFGPNDATKNFSVLLLQEGTYEMDEALSLFLVPEAGETAVNIQGSGLVIIEDSDTVSVGFDSVEYTASEMARAVNVSVRLLEGTLDTDVQVRLSVVSLGTDLAQEGTDFVLPVRDLTFTPSGARVLFVEIQLIDDPFFEGREKFTLQLEANQPRIILGPDRTSVSIVDNEDLVIEFSNSTYSVNEGDSSVTVLVTKMVDIERDVTLNIATMDGRATAGNDYVAVSQTITFTPTSSSNELTITLLDDSDSEGTEEFFVNIIVVDENLGRPGEIQRASVLIFDDENIFIQFARSTFTASEGDRILSFVIAKSGETQQNIDIIISISDGSAEGGKDYGVFPTSSLNLTATILSSETQIQFGVPLREDEIVEGTESFSATLFLTESQQGGGNTFIRNITMATALIVDNDAINVTISPEMVTRNESGTILLFEVFRVDSVMIDTNLTIPVQVETLSGSAIAGQDFMSSEAALQFTRGLSSNFTFNVTLLEDEIVEGPENFSVVLSVGDDKRNLVSFNRQSALVRIMDNDVVTVSISTTIYEVSERSSTVTIFLVKNAETADPLTIILQPSEMTPNLVDTFRARADVDFNSSSIVVTFKPKEQNVSVEIPLINDQMSGEGKEVFAISFSVAKTSANVVMGEIARAMVIINDVPDVTFGFVSASITEDESVGTFPVCIAIFNPALGRDLNTSLIFDVNSVSITADSSDFTFTNTTLTFDNSVRRSCLDVTILDNEEFEDFNEIFNITISNIILSNSDLTAFALRNSTQVIIMDNDREVTLGYEQNSTSIMVKEEVGGVTLCVAIFSPGIDKEFESDITVVVSTRPRTADPRDYKALDFADRDLTLLLDFTQRRTCFQVEIIDDTTAEGSTPESFQVQLTILATQTSDLQRVIATPALATISIEDNEAEISVGFEQTSFDVDESVGSIQVCVRLMISNQSRIDDSFGVRFMISEESTAEFQVDYDLTRGVILTFNNSQRKQCFDVNVTDDQIFETDVPESIILQLSSVVLGIELPTNVSTATILIRDNEVATTPPMVTTPTETTTTPTSPETATTSPETATTSPETTTTPPETKTTPPEATTTPPEITTTPPETTTTTPETTTTPSETTTTPPETTTMPPETTSTTPETTTTPSETTTTPTETPRPPTVFGNDTVVGDPLFSVPLTFTREGFENLPRGAKGIPHLCYEIHGQANSSFNLLSDACTSVNALYSAMETTEPVGFNVLTKIGISALNSINQCVFIEVGLENGCTPIIRSSDRDGDGILDPMEMIRFESHGVSVAKRRRHVRVSVPNCDGARRLVMYVMCDLNTSVPMIRFDVTRGINLSPTSHGLIGQFWNVPVTIRSHEYTGITPTYLDVDNLYTMSIVPPSPSTSRTFVTEYFTRKWDLHEATCFFAGSIQGGSLLEITEPDINDPVIEGVYTDYIVDGILQNSYKFSQFNNNRCNVVIP